MKFKLVFFMTTSIVISGCAGYSIKYKGTGNGFDIYRPDPYLLVKPSEKGPIAEIVWFPNFNERYRVKTWNFLGKADFQFEITDGWKLTKITDKSDNTDITNKLLDIVKNSTKSDTIALTGSTPMLFKFVYDSNGYISKLEWINIEQKSK